MSIAPKYLASNAFGMRRGGVPTRLKLCANSGDRPRPAGRLTLYVCWISTPSSFASFRIATLAARTSSANGETGFGV